MAIDLTELGLFDSSKAMTEYLSKNGVDPQGVNIWTIKFGRKTFWTYCEGQEVIAMRQIQNVTSPTVLTVASKEPTPFPWTNEPLTAPKE